MTDILERLDSYRDCGFWSPTADHLLAEVADEIKRLRKGWKKEADRDCRWALKENERLRTALQKISEYEQDYGGNDWGWRDIADEALESGK